MASVTHVDDLAGSGGPGFEIALENPAGSAAVIDEVLLKIRFSAPVSPGDVSFLTYVADSVAFQEVTALRSSTDLVMRVVSLDLAAGSTKTAFMSVYVDQARCVVLFFRILPA